MAAADNNNNNDDSRMALVLLVGTVALLRTTTTATTDTDEETSSSFTTTTTTTTTDTCRFLASALTHGWELLQSSEAQPAARHYLVQLLSASASSSQSSPDTTTTTTTASIDLHIVCMLARTIGWTACTTTNDVERRVVATAVVQHQSTDLPAALQLAAQLQPYDDDDTTPSTTQRRRLSPHDLIQTAVAHNLWTAAERIALRAAELPSTTTVVTSSPLQTLVSAALDAHMYRLADAYVSADDRCAGVILLPPTLRLAARYLHVCSTITKLMRKQAWPIIERQVLRVDAAVHEWGGGAMVDDDDDEASTTNTTEECDYPTTFATACTDIRRFALDQLTAQGHIDGAQRLATVWDMPCTYSATALAALRAIQRETYLQWEELYHVHHSKEPPELIDDPVVLREQFVRLLAVDTSSGRSIIGFDAEWDDEGTGVAVLQLASNGGVVLLLDIVQLSATLKGSTALCDTVGALLFADTAYIKVGFACGQDVRRLRSARLSLGHRKQHEHGMLQQGVHRVMDLKKLVPGQGLSRCCQKYLGKPLDKAEQCSQWTRRPLTIQQRTYAALDALTCAVMYSQLVDSQRESDAEQIY